jgi:hypothetical protein
VIVAQLVNKSAGADLRAMAMLLAIIEKIETNGEAARLDSETAVEPFGEADVRVIGDALARFVTAGGQNND